MNAIEFQQYLSDGVADIVSEAMRAVLKDPRESAFMVKFALAAKKASAKRLKAEKNGEHIPSYLIASITSNCNLHCAGCYSRSNHACTDEEPVEQLSGEDWDRIFTEAGELGLSFVLLAGGEPLLRRDVIESAAKHGDLMFPIFTNGYFISDKYIDLFDKHRNLLPVISLEGGSEATDSRRGSGVYERVTESMKSIRERGLYFGVSVTVTKKNLSEVSSDEFIGRLRELGCKAVIFVEYVPVSEETAELAFTDTEREALRQRTDVLRREIPDIVFLEFPGDEKLSGGCTAAGRGFFHINSHGGAEPCPFSPYSDINVKETSLREALHSKLFRTLQAEDILAGEHIGGCVLFEKKDQIEKILANAR